MRLNEFLEWLRCKRHQSKSSGCNQSFGKKLLKEVLTWWLLQPNTETIWVEVRVRARVVFHGSCSEFILTWGTSQFEMGCLLFHLKLKLTWVIVDLLDFPPFQLGLFLLHFDFFPFSLTCFRFIWNSLHFSWAQMNPLSLFPNIFKFFRPKSLPFDKFSFWFNSSWA